MKHFLLILITSFFLLANNTNKINEYLSDVYFANGINTSFYQAKESKELLEVYFLLNYHESYVYTNNWNISYNDTHGMGIDLYESMLQKIDENSLTSYTWEVMDLLDYTFKGLVKKAILKVGKKAMGNFAKKTG